MLTKADDYPIHQTPEPVAFVGSERNFYDRFFFNGYQTDGSVFFGAALGVYPHLSIMDGAFTVAHEGVQHSLRVSRHMMGERMDTQVGPLSVEIVEPLKTLRVKVAANDHGVEADLTFQGRSPPLEEPRQRAVTGARTTMDLTRMTQNGRWSGWISVQGQRIEISPQTVQGTRDRSWGVRQVGMANPQKLLPHKPSQAFWLWAPLHMSDREILFYGMENAHGEPLVQGAQISRPGGGEPEHMADAFAELRFTPGTREIAHAALRLVRRRGQGEIRVDLAPRRAARLFLNGLGYGHPEWGHGFDKGELAIGYDTQIPAEIIVHAAPFQHAQFAHFQAVTEATATFPDGLVLKGQGVLEQIVLGDHAPSGLTGLLDPKQ